MALRAEHALGDKEAWMRAVLLWLLLLSGAAFTVGDGSAANATGRIAWSVGVAPAGGGILKSQIFVANEDGSARKQLTTSGDNAQPAWSPDGAKIAYTNAGPGYYEIFVMSAGGASPVQLTSGAPDKSSPAWSPGGSIIAFTTNQGESHQIFTVPVAGDVQPTRIEANGLAPAWSPDGSKIAFSGGTDSRLYTISAEGGGRHRVIARSGLSYEQAPSWSPDGKKLVFTGGTADTPHVFVVGIDGVGLKQLTFSAARASYPRFSPDGTKILYGEGGKVVVMNADGSGVKVLATFAGEITGTAWFGTAKQGGAKPAPAAPRRESCTPGHKIGHLLEGTPSADLICGTSGDDHIETLAGADVIWAGAGNDSLDPGAGRDTVYGEAGNDAAFIKDGQRDVFDGGPGIDCVTQYDKGLDVLRSVEREGNRCLPRS